MLIHLYILSAAIAIVAWVYATVLTDSGMMLYSFKGWLYRVLPTVVYKAVVGCVYCVSGQAALWFYLWIALHDGYDLLQHIALICFAIFNTCIIVKLRLYGNS